MGKGKLIQMKLNEERKIGRKRKKWWHLWEGRKENSIKEWQHIIKYAGAEYILNGKVWDLFMVGETVWGTPTVEE